MFPPRTSLIPVQIALTRFLAANGWRVISQDYPYWYLGTTPFRYLTGPILPGLLLIINRIIPSSSLFTAMFWLLLIVWPLGGVGVYLLLRQLRPGRVLALIAAIIYLLGPLSAWLFSFSDGLSLISFSFLPFALYVYLCWLNRPSKTNAILCIIAICFTILLNSLIVPSLLLGMLAVLLTVSKWRRVEEKLKKTFLILIFSFLICTIWYSPGYWWQLILAPSFAGKPFFQVAAQLFQLLPAALSIGLALVSGRTTTIRKRSPAVKFAFYWLFIFGFLTLMRFIADPDFWLDWLTYAWELQLGLAIAISLVIQNFKCKMKNCNAKFKIFLLLLFIVYCLLFTLIFKTEVLGKLTLDVDQLPEHQIGQRLSQLVKPEEKVFLSGSSVFWLNAWFDINQVRGGKDQASVDPNWRTAVWEIREGDDGDKAVKALKDLQTVWLVVHTSASQEIYHDFKYPEKFEHRPDLEKVYDQDGDRIYRVLP